MDTYLKALSVHPILLSRGPNAKAWLFRILKNSFMQRGNRTKELKAACEE